MNTGESRALPAFLFCTHPLPWGPHHSWHSTIYKRDHSETPLHLTPDLGHLHPCWAPKRHLTLRPHTQLQLQFLFLLSPLCVPARCKSLSHPQSSPSRKTALFFLRPKVPGHPRLLSLSLSLTSPLADSPILAGASLESDNSPSSHPYSSHPQPVPNTEAEWKLLTQTISLLCAKGFHSSHLTAEDRSLPKTYRLPTACGLLPSLTLCLLASPTLTAPCSRGRGRHASSHLGPSHRPRPRSPFPPSPPRLCGNVISGRYSLITLLNSAVPANTLQSLSLPCYTPRHGAYHFLSDSLRPHGL